MPGIWGMCCSSRRCSPCGTPSCSTRPRVAWLLSEGGKAERAFGGHLAGLLRVSRPRAVTMLHTSLTRAGVAGDVRGVPVGCVRVAGGGGGRPPARRPRRVMRGSSTTCKPRRVAAEAVPQRLDVLLSRLHDSLDHDDAIDAAATAHRCRGVRARPGVLPGSAVLSVTGPETDIAAVYETARRAAVAAHGVEGESRSLQQLMVRLHPRRPPPRLQHRHCRSRSSRRSRSSHRSRSSR